LTTLIAIILLIVLIAVIFGAWMELLSLRRFLMNFKQLIVNILRAQTAERERLLADLEAAQRDALDQPTKDLLSAEAHRLGVDDQPPTT
jgi:hypothetical protein